MDRNLRSAHPGMTKTLRRLAIVHGRLDVPDFGEVLVGLIRKSTIGRTRRVFDAPGGRKFPRRPDLTTNSFPVLPAGPVDTIETVQNLVDLEFPIIARSSDHLV